MRPIFFALVSLVALAGLFALAGTAAWWNAWAFFAVLLFAGVLTARAFKQTPGLAAERRTAAAKAALWDRRLVHLLNLALPAMLLAAALDTRFRALPAVPAWLSAVALVLALPAVWLTYRAMLCNAFFSSHVRIQADRGHTVVSAGPYAVVRHPGYTGSIAFNLLAPIILGSWAACAPALAAAALLVYRTGKEDRILQAELPGYAAYTARVRARLLPSIW
jgi:protein-S-isoprenylcysteine O-methyltransferase Ste14